MGGHCGTRGTLLSRDVAGVEDCAALALGAGVTAFSLGIKYARGRCYAEGLEVTTETHEEFMKNRAHPPCPGGEWTEDQLYDFYILIPIKTAAAAEAPAAAPAAGSAAAASKILDFSS